MEVESKIGELRMIGIPENSKAKFEGRFRSIGALAVFCARDWVRRAVRDCVE